VQQRRQSAYVHSAQKTVADFYKIKVADMYSKKRPASIARPRQIAMYLAKDMTQKGLPDIGELFGGRDHTTVLHAVRKIAGDWQNDTPSRTSPPTKKGGPEPCTRSSDVVRLAWHPLQKTPRRKALRA